MSVVEGHTVFPAAIGLPSVVATTMRSFDSSEWNVPKVPPAHELLMVLGWFGSAGWTAEGRLSAHCSC